MQQEFQFHGIAKCRRSDPMTSYKAADSMNTDKAKRLNERQDAVLRALQENNGITAKALGKIMGQASPERYSYPHKRMRELESLGYIRRFAGKNSQELECFITEAGILRLS